MKESPKGKFRMWEWCVAAAILFGAVFLLNGQQWFTYIVNSLATASVGVIVLYYSCRTILHERTHELATNLKDDRQNYLVLAIAIVVGCSLIS